MGRRRPQLTATTHVDNVVEGLVLAAEKGTPGEAYFVTDGEPRSCFREFVSDCSAPRGSSRPRARFPPGWEARCARSASRPGKCCRCRAARRYARFTLWVLTQECTIDDSKARRELGYEPIVSREQGLEELREGRRASAPA